MIYIYDGTFEGLFTAIYEAYYRKEQPDRILSHEVLQQNLFESYVHIATVSNYADRVYTSIRLKISENALQHAYYTFLSEFEDAGTWIYRYLQLGWKVGRKLDLHLSDDRVLAVHKASRKVTWENHRMLGLLRFKKVYGDIFYAPVEPDHNIVSLLAPHFAERLAAQNWIIHDIKRKLGAVYNKSGWYVTELDLNPNLSIDKEEIEYQHLWKQYFDSIAIKSRTNERCQKQHMPQRYWKHLIEKQL